MTPMVFVVTNGMGGQVDSAWTDKHEAEERAMTLNRPGANQLMGGFSLAWEVVPAPLDTIVREPSR